ncbi:MAG: hypothetical protein ACR2QM_11125 [Longimicrobiales bacterium]
MPGVLGFATAFGLMVLYLLFQARKAGPRQLSDALIARGRPLIRVESGTQNQGWGGLGTKTSTRGIDVRFDHDDDPQAEATLYVPGRSPGESTQSLANRMTVDLESEFTDYHVHTSGYVFRIRMRGTGKIVGRQTRIQMVVDGSGRAVGGRMENDDDTRAAVGDWIEVEYAEVLEIPDVRG